MKLIKEQKNEIITLKNEIAALKIEIATLKKITTIKKSMIK